MMKNLLVSLKLAVLSSLCCCLLYSLVLCMLAQIFVPKKASGQLLRNYKEKVVGSRLIAQTFVSDKYFHGRPDRDGRGSNLSPASKELRKRVEAIVQAYHASDKNPLPADLAMGSGSGLDPHITVAAARFQVVRIAATRNIPAAKLEQLINKKAFYPCRILDSTQLVNVLELNVELDKLQLVESSSLDTSLPNQTRKK